MRRTLRRRLERIGAEAQEDFASHITGKISNLAVAAIERRLEELPFHCRSWQQWATRPGRPQTGVQVAMNSLILRG